MVYFPEICLASGVAFYQCLQHGGIGLYCDDGVMLDFRDCGDSGDGRFRLRVLTAVHEVMDRIHARNMKTVGRRIISSELCVSGIGAY